MSETTTPMTWDDIERARQPLDLISAIAGTPEPDEDDDQGDPTTVNIEQVRAAYDAMGLDPDQWDNTRQVEFDPHEVRAIRYVRDESGSDFVADELGNPEVVVTTMRIARENP